jgi:preprotein translocase subunit SecF
MEFIKHGSKFDFMGKSHYFIWGSGILTLISLILVFTIGFDSGIDFKGGTKIITEFKAHADVDRDAVKKVVDDVVKSQTKREGTQVEVQDYDVGASGDSKTVKFQIYTELPSLLAPTGKLELAKNIEKHFGKGTVVESPFEAGDKFYLYLTSDWPREAAVAEISKVFAAAGHDSVSIVSDKEQRIHSDMLREKDLLLSSSDSDVKAEAEKVETEAARKIAGITDSRYVVEVQAIKDLLSQKMTAQFGDKFVDVISTATVSPSVGKELFQTSMLALFYAIIGILIYVSIRFDMKFAPGAIVCLIHDVIVVFGVMVVFKVKFTLPIVAALLTIIGYDINDTIIVYDRIRENIGRGRGGDLRTIMNASINETLSRTIITSLTTELTVGAIWLLGGGTTADFAFLLFVGIILGTYSSIFIAAPLTLLLDKISIRRRKMATSRA